MITGIKEQKLRIGNIVLTTSLMLFILACGGSKETNSVAKEKEFQNLVEMVKSREFVIENEWLTPLGGAMINLIGNPNYIRFEGDSVDVFLPYYGVRQSGGGYGTDGGIVYKGGIENLKISEESEKNRILLNFEGSENQEHLKFFITLFNGGDATTSVSSSQRQSISYKGNIAGSKKKEN